MTNPKTRADYDALTVIATRFDNEARQIGQTIRALTEAMTALQNGDWVGQGATAFFAEMNSHVLPSMTRLMIALQSAARLALQIRAAMQQAEAEAAALLRDTGAEAGLGSAGGKGLGLAKLQLPQSDAAERAWAEALQTNSTLQRLVSSYQAAPSADALAGIREFFCWLIPALCGGTPTPTPTPTPPPITMFPTVPRAETTTPMPTPLPTPAVTPQPTVYPTAPPVVSHSQYAEDIVQSFGYNACGLVSFAAAAEALGLSYTDTMDWFKKNALKYGYTEEHGMQPSDYLKSIQDLIAEKKLSMTVKVVNGLADENTLQTMQTELAGGKQIIVDFLAQKPSTFTTPSDSASKEIVTDTFSHLTRVVGFSSDGTMVYLAELLDPKNPTIAVSTATLLLSMKNPEGRAENNVSIREQVSNWMIVIQ